MSIVWPPKLDWNCPSGTLLTSLGRVVPRERRTPIILFGSGALQITIAPHVLSADADIAPDIIPYDPRSKAFPNPLSREELTTIVSRNELGPKQKRVFLHVCAPGTFNPGSKYVRRAIEVKQGNLQITIPHPIDILVAKLHRYDEKDRDDFKKVFSRTGFPTPEELLAELRTSPRLFDKRDPSLEIMPSQFGKSKITENVPKVFRDLWGMRVSVKKDILLPAAKAVEADYHTRTHKKGVADIASTPLNAEEKE